MNYLLLVFALVHAGLLLWTFRPGNSQSSRLWLLRLLLLGMCYDNLVQGVGNWFIEAPWYQGANYPRYILHTSILPFLTIFGLATMQLAGVRMASSAWLVGFCAVFTSLALGWGWYHEVFLLELGPKPALGVQKLGSLSAMPPIATILTNIFILPMGAAIWRVSGWRWFFLGALFILVLNGATGAKPWGFVIGNFAEVVFILCLLATERRFSAK